MIKRSSLWKRTFHVPLYLVYWLIFQIRVFKLFTKNVPTQDKWTFLRLLPLNFTKFFVCQNRNFTSPFPFHFISKLRPWDITGSLSNYDHLKQYYLFTPKFSYQAIDQLTRWHHFYWICTDWLFLFRTVTQPIFLVHIHFYQNSLIIRERQCPENF